MASLEIIALLCAGSTRYHPGLGGGQSELTRAEISGLLSGLSEQAMDFALAKYAGDEQAERMLLAYMRTWAAGIAVNESWKIIRGRPTMVNMVAVAVFECVRPNRCSVCNGRGFARNKVCHCCQGSGIKSISNNSIAQAIGVDKSNFSRVWQARYNMIYDRVNEYDLQTKKALSINDLSLNKKMSYLRA